jgi:UPF0042 nucleotide-binding protein
MKLVIVSGLSGAGKTVALKQYEDLGFDCIDNLPLALLEDLVHRSLAEQPPRYTSLAIGVDARERPDEIHRFPHYIERLRAQGVQLRVLFLTTEINVLLQRYSETRRRHPLSAADRPLTEAIEREQRLLEPIANTADAVIDTTDLNLYALRERIQAEIPGGGRDKLAITLVSFGFKHGTPADADFVFDVRCLPNPHWNRDLRPMSGRESPVADWLAQHEDVRRMRADLLAFLRHWLPRFRSQDRAYLTVAIGCTGGKHRSVYLVDQIAASLRAEYDPLIVRHRELGVVQEALP